METLSPKQEQTKTLQNCTKEKGSILVTSGHLTLQEENDKQVLGLDFVFQRRNLDDRLIESKTLIECVTSTTRERLLELLFRIKNFQFETKVPISSHIFYVM